MIGFEVAVGIGVGCALGLLVAIGYLKAIRTIVKMDADDITWN